MRLPSVTQVIQESGRIVRRFPVVIVCALLGTAAALILVDRQQPLGPSILFNTLLAAMLGIPLLMALTLAVERRKGGGSVYWISQLIGVILLIIYAFLIPTDLSRAPAIYLVRSLTLFIALCFMVMVAPFVAKGQLTGFWQYNKTLFFRILTTFLYAVVLYAGLALALAALNNLFGMSIPGRRYAELWILINGLFSTAFFLAGVPENMESLDTITEYPRGLKVFTQYVLSPLVLVYFVILYAYIAKIIVTWNWPQGWVSRLILGFSATGLVALLALAPIREKIENKWMRTASRWFFMCLTPLVVVLFLALWKRISEYGITEGRYLGIAIGIWLAVIAAYFIIGKTKSIKVIPATLCLLAFLISCGPWGMFSISEKSQIGRLKELLSRNSILVNGTVQKAPAEMSFEDAGQISSILDYLHDTHGLNGIQPWFRESLRQDSAGAPSWFISSPEVAELMGIQYSAVWRGTAEGMIFFRANEKEAIDIAGYDKMLSDYYVDSLPKNRSFSDNEITFAANAALDTLTFTSIRDGKVVESLSVNLQPVMDELVKNYSRANRTDIPIEKMSAASAGNSLKVKVYLTRIQLLRHDDTTKTISYNMTVLYSLGEKTPQR